MWFSIVMFVYQRVKLLLLCWVYHIGPGWSVSLRLPTSVSHEKVRFKHSIGTHNVLQTIEGLISIFHEHQCTIYTQQVKQQGKHAGFQGWWCVECMWPPDSIKCTADPQEKKTATHLELEPVDFHRSTKQTELLTLIETHSWGFHVACF